MMATSSTSSSCSPSCIITYTPSSSHTLVSVTPSTSPSSTTTPVHLPVDLVLALDTSGSMSRPSNERAEGIAALYSRLDLVKHVARIASAALRENDRLAIVEFNCDVRIIHTLDAPLSSIDDTLNTLQPEGATNMWNGLHTSLEHLKACGRQDALKSVFLLTDGVPMPARREGEENLTKQWFDENGASNVTLHTFGFGYDLNSNLLVQMARNGHGSYNFIPDHSMLATVINSALANVGTTVLDHADVPLPDTAAAAAADVNASLLLGGPHNVLQRPLQRPHSSFVRIHSLRAGQTRHLLLRGEHAIPGATLELSHLTSQLKHQVARCAFIAGVNKAYTLARIDLDDARKVLRDEVVPNLVSSDPSSSPLAADLYGQVSEAIGTREAFERWGLHYLPSLVGAHFDERVNNFKDAGVAAYTTPAYEEAIGRLDSAFDLLAPPPPTIVERQSAGTTMGVPVVVGGAAFRNAFYNQSGGCLTAQTIVAMADGTQRRVDDLRKGDVVQTPEGGGAVHCIAACECADDEVEIVALEPDVELTPWHPVRSKGGAGSWEFPAKLGETITRTQTPEVYNLLLEPGHTGVLCGSKGTYYAITLAHGIEDDAVAQHEFFGTQRVVDAYRALPGFEQGRVVIHAESFARDPETLRVIGVGSQHQGAGA